MLIPAAGSGLRLGANEPKALVPVAGRPMLAWSVLALSAVDGVTEILVAAPPASVAAFESLRGTLGVSAWRSVVPGGDTRRESVGHLLSRASGERVLVHDAARPCVTTVWVNALLRELGEDPAGVPGVPVRDTLKRGRGGVVTDTVPREGLFVIQTPQLFRTDVLRRAHANDEDPGVTDDAVLVERLGERVRLLRGDPANLKVTYPDDVAIATRYLEARS